VGPAETIPVEERNSAQRARPFVALNEGVITSDAIASRIYS
jgi:hypothetical protein